MKLYLVRHGEAEPSESDDGRALSKNGVNRVKKSAVFLKKNGIEVGIICHSVKKRAAGTAALIAGQIRPRKGLEEREGLKPGDNPVIWAKISAGLDENTMLVGHLPHLGRLASLLLTGDGGADFFNIPDGGVLCLERNETGGWRLDWFVHPDII